MIELNESESVWWS